MLDNGVGEEKAGLGWDKIRFMTRNLSCPDNVFLPSSSAVLGTIFPEDTLQLPDAAARKCVIFRIYHGDTGC